MDWLVSGVLQDIEPDVACLFGRSDRMGQAVLRGRCSVRGHVDDLLPRLVVRRDFNGVCVASATVVVENWADEVNGFFLLEVDRDRGRPFDSEPCGIPVVDDSIDSLFRGMVAFLCAGRGDRLAECDVDACGRERGEVVLGTVLESIVGGKGNDLFKCLACDR